MVQYILDLLHFHGVLLKSEHCVLLHGASEMGDSGGSARQQGEGAVAAGTGALAAQMAAVEVSSAETNPAGTGAVEASVAGASSDTGSAGAGAGAGVAGAEETEQDHDPSQADQELLGLIAETHTPEVRTGERVWVQGRFVRGSRVGVCFVPRNSYTHHAVVRL